MRGSPYCYRLTVGYSNISEFRTPIQLHLSSQVPQDWLNAHFSEVIQVQISLHRYWQKNLTKVLQDWFRWHPIGCSVWHNAAEIQNVITLCSTMCHKQKLKLAHVRLGRINCFSDLPDYMQGHITSALAVHTHTPSHTHIKFLDISRARNFSHPTPLILILPRGIRSCTRLK